MKTVLVTGANGFVGKPVCRRLLEAGWQVHGCIRRPEAATGLPAGVRPIPVPDITESVDWSRFLQGVDAVVHLVARTHVMHDTAEDPLALYRKMNVTGTRQLIEACLESSVSRFVFMSSIKAVGEGAAQTYTETTPCRPEDAYGISKREAEQLVLDVTDGTRLGPVILRPPLIYGPEVRGNLLRLLRIARRGTPLPLGAVRNARSMVYVENLASAVEAALEHPNAVGEIFHVADEESLSTRELVRRLAVLQKSRARLVSCPVALLRLAGGLLGKSAEIRRLVGSLTVSPQKIQERLQWSPPYSVEEGLWQMVAWFEGCTVAAQPDQSQPEPYRRAA